MPLIMGYSDAMRLGTAARLGAGGLCSPSPGAITAGAAGRGGGQLARTPDARQLGSPRPHNRSRRRVRVPHFWGSPARGLCTPRGPGWASPRPSPSHAAGGNSRSRDPPWGARPPARLSPTRARPVLRGTGPARPRRSRPRPRPRPQPRGGGRARRVHGPFRFRFSPRDQPRLSPAQPSPARHTSARHTGSARHGTARPCRGSAWQRPGSGGISLCSSCGTRAGSRRAGGTRCGAFTTWSFGAGESPRPDPGSIARDGPPRAASPVPGRHCWGFTWGVEPAPAGSWVWGLHWGALGVFRGSPSSPSWAGWRSVCFQSSKDHLDQLNSNAGAPLSPGTAKTEQRCWGSPCPAGLRMQREAELPLQTPAPHASKPLHLATALLGCPPGCTGPQQLPGHGLGHPLPATVPTSPR